MSLADATTVSPRTRLSLADVIAREDRRHRRRIAGAWIAFAVALLAAAAGYYVLLMVTHDPRCARYAPREVRFIDGRIAADERGAHA